MTTWSILLDFEKDAGWGTEIKADEEASLINAFNSLNLSPVSFLYRAWHIIATLEVQAASEWEARKCAAKITESIRPIHIKRLKLHSFKVTQKK